MALIVIIILLCLYYTLTNKFLIVIKFDQQKKNYILKKINLEEFK